MSLQYIIDGYNIIHNPIFIRHISEKITDKRLALLGLLKEKRLAGSRRNTVAIIFDGYPEARIMGVLGEDDLGIEVIFSRKETADARISKILEKSANPKNTVVVTDDKEIKFFAKSCGAKTLSAEEFFAKAKERRQEPIKPEISYSAMHKINQELRELWLK